AVGLFAVEASGEPAKGSPRQVPLDVATRVGASVRLGDAPNFPIDERTGAVVGVSIFASPSPRFSLGLSYEHTGLGYERGGRFDAERVEVSRALDALLAGLRLHLWEGELVRLWAVIGPGLAWQSAEASGFVSGGFGTRPIGLRCSATGGPDLALRAGVGAEFSIGSGFWFVTDVTLDNARLSSDVVEDCIPGAGAVTLFGARAGFAYRFDDVGRYLR
ncbi:MAG: hypothetical protein ABI193_23960, partial [Minicystis sp.]